MSDEPIAQRIGFMKDEEIKPALCMLMLESANGVVAERYLHHLNLIVRETGERHAALIEAGADDNAETRLAALKHVLYDGHGYAPDDQSPANVQNLSMIRTIDRGRGAAIMLAALYVETGQALGWDVAGQNIPGHFMARLEKDGQRLIFNPAEQCSLMNAASLRGLIKQHLGAKAELSAQYFEPVSNRQFLILLQNILKSRFIEGEDYEAAVKIVEVMRAIDPQEYRVLLDAGVLYARTQRTQAAIAALEDYIEKAPRALDRHDALLLLRQLRENSDP